MFAQQVHTNDSFFYESQRSQRSRRSRDARQKLKAPRKEIGELTEEETDVRSDESEKVEKKQGMSIRDQALSNFATFKSLNKGLSFKSKPELRSLLLPQTPRSHAVPLIHLIPHQTPMTVRNILKVEVLDQASVGTPRFNLLE
jgi:hypothetical protein